MWQTPDDELVKDTPIQSTGFTTPDDEAVEDYWEKTAKNIIPDIAGIAGVVKEGAYDMPMRAMKTGAELSSGVPYSKTTSGALDAPFIENAPAMAKEMVRPVTHPVDYFQEHPVSQTINALGLVGSALPRGMGKAMEVTPGMKNIPEAIGRTADNQMLKSTGASMGQIRQTGIPEARAAAKVARESGLGDIFSTEIGREKSLANLEKTTGQKIGALRKEAGPAPTGIPEKIAADLKAKYGKGGVYSGEGGGLQKALSDVKRLGGENKPDLPVIQPTGKVGEPYALFEGNITGGSEPGLSQYKVYGDHPKTGFNLNPEQLKDLGIPITGRAPTPAAINSEPIGLGTPATHEGYAKAATHLNQYATGEKLKQPVNAITDVANRLSHENNEGIMKALGPKAPEYTKALSDFNAYKTLEQFFNRGELRDMAGRGGAKGIIQQAIQGAADKGGYRLTSKVADALHEALTKPLSIGKLSSQALKAGSITVPAELTEYLTNKYGKKK